MMIDEVYSEGFTAGAKLMMAHHELSRRGIHYGQEVRFPVVALLDDLRQVILPYVSAADNEEPVDVDELINTIDSFLHGVNSGLFEHNY